jgi:serine protease Do
MGIMGGVLLGTGLTFAILGYMGIFEEPTPPTIPPAPTLTVPPPTSPAPTFGETASAAAVAALVAPSTVAVEVDSFLLSGSGSGVVYGPAGYIITNHHVVDGASEVKVRFADQIDHDAEVIGTDPQSDIALLKIKAEGALPHLTLGDSDRIRVGEDVVAVGNPFGLGGTVTRGIVSAVGRDINAGPYVDFIQTDAAINRGNSGGPLFDMDGNVIGVNSAIYSPTGGNVGVGFAIPSNIVRDVVAQLRDDGSVSRGWLGVSIQSVTPDIATALGLDEAKGALVASVIPDSPSEGKLETGDVILTFGGEPVESSRDLPRLVGSTEAGSTVELGVLRGDERQTVSVEIGELRPEQLAAASGVLGEPNVVGAAS